MADDTIYFDEDTGQYYRPDEVDLSQYDVVREEGGSPSDDTIFIDADTQQPVDINSIDHSKYDVVGETTVDGSGIPAEQPENDSSFWDKAKALGGHIAGDLARPVAGGIQAIEEAFPELGTHYGKDLYKNELAKAADEEKILGGKNRGLTSKTLESVGAMAPYLLAGSWAPLAFGLSAAGDKYGELRSEGATPDASVKGAGVSGAGNYLLGKIPFGIASSEAAPLVRYAGGMFGGSFVGPASTILDAYSRYIGTGQQVEPEQLKQQLIESAKVGAATGTALSAVHDVASAPFRGQEGAPPPGESVAPDMLPLPEDALQSAPLVESNKAPSYQEPIILPAAKPVDINGDKLIASKEFPAPEKGLQVETSSARSPEEQQQLQDILYRAQIGAKENAATLQVPGEVPTNPDAGIIKPLTQDGTIRKSLSPEEQAITDKILSTEDLVANQHRQNEELGLLAERVDKLKQRSPEPLPIIQSKPEALAEGQIVVPEKYGEVRESLVQPKSPFRLPDPKVVEQAREHPEKIRAILERLSSEGGSFRPGEIADLVREAFKRRKSDQELSDSEKFFKGELNLPILGRLDIPGLRRAIALTRKISYPSTLADKFEPTKEGYRIATDFHEGENSNLYDFAKQLKSYYDLPKASREKVDALDTKARYSAEEYRNQGKTLPALSDEYLTKQGLNADEIKAYRDRHSALKRAVDIIEEGLSHEADGLPEDKRAQYLSEVKAMMDNLRANEHYVPFSRFGNKFEVRAVDDKGKVLFSSFHDSKREAVKVRELKQREGLKAKLIEKPSQDRDAFDSLPPEMQKLREHFDPTRFAKLAQEMPVGGVGGHLIKANLVPGFNPDIGRNVADYLAGVSRFAPRKAAERRFEQLLSGIDSKVEPLLKKHLKGYRERIINPDDPGVGVVTRIANLEYLAGAISAGVSNLYQQVTTTLPQLYKDTHILYGERSVGRAGKIWAKAEKITGEYFLDRSADKQAFFKKYPNLKLVIEDGMRKGYLDSQAFQDFQHHRLGKTGMTLEEALMLTFSVPEKMNRLHAVVAASELGKRAGLEGEGLTDYVKDFVKRTQFDQSKANRPAIANTALGKLALQFKMFQGHQLRFLRNMANKRDLPALALALGVIGLAAGTRGLPFVKDFDRIREGLGYDPKRAIREFIHNKKFADVYLYGLPTLSGVNQSGSVGTGEYFSQTDESPQAQFGRATLGAGGDFFLSKIPKAVELAKKGKYELAAETAAPRFARNLMKATRGLVTGELRDERGIPTIPHPTLKELGEIALGFTPMRLSDYYEMKHSNYLAKDKGSATEYNQAIAAARISHDRATEAEIQKSIREFNRTAPKEDQIHTNESSIRDYMNKMKDPDKAEIKGARKNLRGYLKETQRLLDRGNP